MTDDDYEEHAYFAGPCTCDHDDEEHTWGSCSAELPDGSECPCEAGWEE